MGMIIPRTFSFETGGTIALHVTFNVSVESESAIETSCTVK